MKIASRIPSHRARPIWVLTAALACAYLTACAEPAPLPASAPAPAPTPAPAPAPARPSPLTLGHGISVDRAAQQVSFPAQVAATEGWMEQAICGTNSREHESLLVLAFPPSKLHAAMLLAGFEPGKPGSWQMVGQGDAATVARVAPTGAAIEIFIRHAGSEVPLSTWLHDPDRAQVPTEHPWVFAGSVIRPNTRSMGPGEHYVADFTGSVAGVVTFGDEVIAFDDVRSDQVEVDAPVWQARTSVMPQSGTAVEVVIRPRRKSG